MEVGIVGLPGVGKTALFHALTGGKGGGTRGGGLAAPNVGVARVPDPRLGTITQFITTKQVIPATFQLVDIPGFAVGGEAAAFARQVLANIREVDAICHVVRCFPGLAGEPVQPRRDIDTMEQEMILADFAVAEPALDKATRAARSNDRDAKVRAAALERAIPVLSEAQALRSVWHEFDEAQQAALRGYGMISAKPVIFLANIGEGDLGGSSSAMKEVADVAAEQKGECVAICAKLEAEIVELNESDRSEMLSSLGLEEPAVSIVARGLYHLLGLRSFYTAGEKEVRAWTIPIGATAPQAAGAIHSDIQRGFIRAECYHVDDLVQHRSEKSIKEAGKMRSEGKSYVMNDGDVVHFLFNV